ncbi:MAG: phage portal protein [Parachlamydiaceae bacterium]|nr:phage portal protein [Parachlamydiaceae bacterium]
MWNAFQNNEQTQSNQDVLYGMGPNYNVRPDRTRLRYTNERSIISAIYTRLSVDLAAIDVRHVMLDEGGRYEKDSDSKLNECFTLEPNLDQAPRAFKQDICMTMFDKGSAAIVPVDTTVNPATGKVFDILTLRVGDVVAWYPRHVRVSLYNIATGSRQEIVLEKRNVAIVENPLYSVMNEPNSTLQRLIRKLNLLDAVDEQSGSGKLDLIIQLPYVIKSEAKRLAADKRREDIEFQLKGSQYGIAYTDATEKITQLNRPAENNLLKQVEYLTTMLYGQLGLTEEVMNGTADEKAMLNYFNRTIEPLVAGIVEAMQRAFVGGVGISNRERIKYFTNPFKLVPVNDLAEIADKFTRNEILTANEIRGFMGLQPSKDPKADKLVNSNMPQPVESTGTKSLERNSQNGS